MVNYVNRLACVRLYSRSLNLLQVSLQLAGLLLVNTGTHTVFTRKNETLRSPSSKLITLQTARRNTRSLPLKFTFPVWYHLEANHVADLLARQASVQKGRA
jgi:hypothetical protein